MNKIPQHKPRVTQIDRVEGREKVTGAAKYAAEYDVPGLCHGILVNSTIAKGKIIFMDTKAAEKAPGVIAVITHENKPSVPGWETSGTRQPRVEGQEYRIFNDAQIYFDRQPVALVVADTLERARHAAMLVKVQYSKEEAHTDIKSNLTKAVKARRGGSYLRGDAEAWKGAPVKLELAYTTPFQVHLPMEMHAATVVWDGPDKVTVYNKTQASRMAQQDIARAFALKGENVTVISPFVGGAFGSSSRVWPEQMAAIMGAKKTGKPVRVMLRREETFNLVGYRPRSIQKFWIGAQSDGTITGISHEAYGSTSIYEQFFERITDPTKVLYNCANVETTYSLVPLDMSTPCWTRGPGETSGSFVLESAMDELAQALKMDPLALRLKNFADKDPERSKPWSSNFLKECYEKGSEKFGWQKRNPIPRSMHKGEWLVGMGMATGIYHAGRSPATVSATLRADGSLLVQTSVADTGPGSATVMTQIAADTMGMEAKKVVFEWGRSTLPPSPGQFGSHTTASTGSGVHDAVRALQKKMRDGLIETKDASFASATIDDIYFEEGNVGIKNKSTKLSYAEVLKKMAVLELKVTNESRPSSEIENYSSYSFCAHFVEVQVHSLTGVVRLSRVVTAVDAGTIINKKMATSQVYGSIAWGIGIALMEEGIVDHRYGRYVNNDLANYHVPVNADIPDIDVIFIDKPDSILDPIGAKGLGEIALVGFPAAIANAVYHATGKRIRELPITPDKLMDNKV